MPAVTRVGDNNTGHDACPPTALVEGSANVFVNGIPAGRVGDSYAPHGCTDHPSHVGTIASGASHCFINGLAAERVGDAVSCGGSVAAGAPNVDVGNGGGEITANCVKASATKTLLWDKAEDTDKTILSLPEIARNMAALANNEEDQKGWNYLSLMFERWLENGARNGETEGVFKQYISDLLGITGLTAAIGAFTIRLLPKGTVETIENGRIKITVNEIAVYADDRFQFKGTYPPLFWSYIDKLFSPFPSSNYKLLLNSDFRQFRILYNKGEDFLIRSKQCKKVDNFNAKTIYLNNTWTVVLDE